LPSQQIIGLKDIAHTAYQPCPKPLVFFALIFAKDYKVTLYMIEANMMSTIINVEIQLNIGTNDQNVIS
jgi:hypothetical protein